MLTVLAVLAALSIGAAIGMRIMSLYVAPARSTFTSFSCDE